MQFLFVSNYYPPFSRGGYEQWCQEIAEELAERGHRVSVLTSYVEGESAISTKGIQVYRQLNLEVIGGLWHTVNRLVRHRTQLEQENLAVTQRLITNLQPDIVMLWGMWNIPRSVPALIEQLLPALTVYFFCDYWPTLPSSYIQQLKNSARSQWTQLPKHIVSKFLLPRLEREPFIPLQFRHPICVSQAVRDLLVEDGVMINHAKIIRGGTHLHTFSKKFKEFYSGKSLKLLYVGRLSEEKGVITAIKSLQQLKSAAVTLTIVGSGEPDYESLLRSIATSQNLTVHFVGKVPHHKIANIMHQHDVLLFTSTWPEPFARTVLEAMAAGLVIIGTTTGGTGEILKEGKTGLTFPAGDEQELAKQIQRLIDQPGLGKYLAQKAKNIVNEQHTFNHMTNCIEQYLLEVVRNSQSVAKVS